MPTHKRSKESSKTTAYSVESAKKVAVSKEVAETQKAAKKASSNALKISKALELPIQYIEKGKLIEIQEGKDKKTIKTIERINSKISLKKGDKIWLGSKD